MRKADALIVEALLKDYPIGKNNLTLYVRFKLCQVCYGSPRQKFLTERHGFVFAIS